MLRILNLPVAIAWKDFDVGTSIFIPCLDRDAVQTYVLEQCRQLSMQVTVKQIIHKGMYGVRVWRVG